jgi:hypothetical protein
MTNHDVELNFRKRCAVICKGRRCITVNWAPLVQESLQKPAKEGSFEPLLSALQIKRMARKGNPIFLMVLKEIKGETNDPVPPWVQSLQKEYGDVFQDPLPVGVPPRRNRVHEIPTEPGHTPPFRPLYRLSPIEMEEARKQVTFLLERGLIEPSVSPYGASILFVPKPNGRGLRMCVDYRALNSVSIKNRYPLPRIDDMLDTVAGAKYFTSLDLTSGYWQIQIDEKDIPKTAFRTPFGHFQWKVMPFGLTNAPATFQSVMNDVFRPHLRDFVVVYLDDILIYSKTEEEHQKHVQIVLDLLRKEKFYACLDKSTFAQQECKFLGRIISKDGVKVDPRKIEAVRDWPIPKDQHQVRSFLGLANYFRRFIQGFSTLAAPLSALTRAKATYEWTPECHKAFEGIKHALTHAPILVSPDSSKPFTVVCDASLGRWRCSLTRRSSRCLRISKAFTGGA